jgi:hypothetical protein
MALVTSKEIAKVLHLQKLGFVGQSIGWLFLRVLGFKTLNKIYDRNKNKTGVHFLDDVLKDCNIQFEIPEEDLKRLPKNGPFAPTKSRF